MRLSGALNPLRRWRACEGFIFAAALAATVAACSDSGSGPSLPLASVYVRFPAESVFVGSTLRVTAVATGSDSASVAWPRFAWTSSDTSVAVVDSTGAVLGLDIGTTIISAKFGALRDSITVRVVLHEFGEGKLFASTGVGETSLCALTLAGTAYCSPWSFDEQLPQFAMLPGADSVSLVSLSAAKSHQCGLTASGAIYCWGTNSSGQFLTGTSIPFSTTTGPVQGGGARRFAAIAVAAENSLGPNLARHTCAIDQVSREVLCAGNNASGQLGRSGPQVDTTVAPVPNGFRARRISASQDRTCAIDETGGLWCWGNGGFGSTTAATPKAMSPGTLFTDVYTADNTICALASDGQMMCAAIGSGVSLTSIPLAPVATPFKFSSIVSGITYVYIAANAVTHVTYTCGITTAGELVCWGDFPPAAISSRRGNQRLTPIRLARSVKFRTISADLHHLCGVTVANKLVCL